MTMLTDIKTMKCLLYSMEIITWEHISRILLSTMPKMLLNYSIMMDKALVPLNYNSLKVTKHPKLTLLRMWSHEANCISNWACKISMHAIFFHYYTEETCPIGNRPCMESMPHWGQANHYTRAFASVTLKLHSVEFPSQALTYKITDSEISLTILMS